MSIFSFLLLQFLKFLLSRLFLDYYIVSDDDVIVGSGTSFLSTSSISEKSRVKRHFSVDYTCCSMNQATGCLNNELNTVRFTKAFENVTGKSHLSKHSDVTWSAARLLSNAIIIASKNRA